VDGKKDETPAVRVDTSTTTLCVYRWQVVGIFAIAHQDYV